MRVKNKVFDLIVMLLGVRFISAALILVLVVAICICWYRRARRSRRTQQNRDYRAVAQSESVRRSNVVQYIDKEGILSRPRPLQDYKNIDNKIEETKQEFKELEIKLKKHKAVPNSEPNMSQYDRFKSIFARGVWDKTAIRLTGAHRIYNYINANLIKSSYDEKTYIATQGPLGRTCEDFWDMILQSGVQKIVMLTPTQEANPDPSKPKDQCYGYFPIERIGTLKFGKINVEATCIENHEDVQVRRISVKRKNIKHSVMHFYFTNWPYHGVISPKDLYDLIDKVNNYELYATYMYKKSSNDLKPPVVVHCSAGIGRTGTYITASIIAALLDRSEELSTMELDIFGIVDGLRQQRMGMVCTDKQYLLLHRFVKVYLSEKDPSSSVAKSIGYYPMPKVNQFEKNVRTKITTESPLIHENSPVTTKLSKSNNDYIHSNSKQRLSENSDKPSSMLSNAELAPPIPPRRPKQFSNC